MMDIDCDTCGSFITGVVEGDLAEVSERVRESGKAHVRDWSNEGHPGYRYFCCRLCMESYHERHVRGGSRSDPGFEK